MQALDIGSAGGNNYPWKSVGFDAQENLALSDSAGESELYITRNPDNSSLLKPNSQFWKGFPSGSLFDVVEIKRVETAPLDAFKIKADFIKIDVQGAEGMVIRGGMNTISQAACVQIEVNFAQRYLGQSFLSEVDPMMRSMGFELFDLKRRYYKRNCGVGGPRGILTHGDALYIKPPTPPEILDYFGYSGSSYYGFTGQTRFVKGVMRRLLRLLPSSKNGVFGDENIGNRDYL